MGGREVEVQLVGPEGQRHVQVQRGRGYRRSGDPSVPGWRLETLSDKNFELYEGMSPSLVFQLSHTAMEAMVFCAENDNFAEKWTNALREATTLSIPESSA